MSDGPTAVTRTNKPCCNTLFDDKAMLTALGPLSSHPKHAPLRLILWTIVALAPLLAGIAFVALWLNDGSVDRTRFLINNSRSLALYGLAATGFAMGLGLTAFAVTVAARSTMLVLDDGVRLAPVLAGMAMLFLLGLAAWLVPLAMSASPQTRLLVAWLGLLPLMLVLSLATFLPYDDSAGELKRRPFRLWTIVLPAMALAFVVATRTQAVAQWLEQLSVIKTPLTVLMDAAGASGLQPGAVATMKSWFLTGVIGIAACPLLALTLAAMNLLGRSAVDAMSLGDANAELGGSGTAAEDAPSHAADEDPCNDFFVEKPATLKQAAAFHQIVVLAEECHAATPGNPTKPFPSADVMLEGPLGSGRTATMIAALLQGTLVTGDTAIVLVQSGTRRDVLIDRLNMATKGLQVDGFVGIRPLTPEDVAEWTGSPDAPSRPDGSTVPPRILVGTLAGLEAAFFSAPYSYEALRRALLQVDTVAIDDLDGFRIDERLHLPHALAKLRLIRATEGQPLRTILVTRTLAAAARELVARQLLKSVSLDGHLLRLDTVPPPPEASLEVVPCSADEPEVTTHRLAMKLGRACRAEGMNVLVFAPEATRVELTEIVSGCRGPRGQDGGTHLCAIDDLNAIPTLGKREHGLVAAAVCAELRGDGRASCVVAWNDRQTTAKVFKLPTASKSQVEAPAANALMVLPGKESESLFAQHFASAARFLPRLLPIPRALLTAMGLPSVGTLQASATRYRQRPNDMVTVVDRILLLDPQDSSAGAIAADPARWPSGALAGFGDDGPPAPRRVVIRGPNTASMGILSDPSGATVTILEQPTALISHRSGTTARTVSWKAADGTELAADDLAYMHSFCLRTEQGAFVPNRMHQAAGGTVVIDARPILQDDRLQPPSMPAFTLTTLSMPTGVTLKRILQSSPLAHRVAVFGIVAKSEAAGVDSAATIPQVAAMRLAGLYDSEARLRDWDIHTSYEAAKFFVLFDPPDMAELSPILDESLLIDWGASKPASHEDFPELAAAITSAMAWQAPGLERLVRCLGFRIVRGDDTPLVGVVFIEPRSTESSGFTLMEPIVYDLDVMQEFFGKAAHTLQQAAQSSSPGATLYAKAGIAINPRVLDGRLDAGPESIAMAMNILQGIAAEARGRL
jgi:hypothetical protein